MKSLITMCTIVAASAGLAMADMAPTQYAGTLSGTQAPQGDPSGDAFFVAPGIGNAGGFFLAGGPFVDSVAGGTGVIGGSLDGSTTIELSSSITDNGGGNYDIAILLFSTDGSDMFPAGFVDGGGLALDTAGFFMGANAGANPLDFSGAAITNSASIEIFDAAGPAGGPFDILAFANFTALGGGWDGSLGVTFGAGSAGAGINAMELLVNVTVVPAPAGLASLAGVGLFASRRRRA